MFKKGYLISFGLILIIISFCMISCESLSQQQTYETTSIELLTKNNIEITDTKIPKKLKTSEGNKTTETITSKPADEKKSTEEKNEVDEEIIITYPPKTVVPSLADRIDINTQYPLKIEDINSDYKNAINESLFDSDKHLVTIHSDISFNTENTTQVPSNSNSQILPATKKSTPITSIQETESREITSISINPSDMSINEERTSTDLNIELYDSENPMKRAKLPILLIIFGLLMTDMFYKNRTSSTKNNILISNHAGNLLLEDKTTNSINDDHDDNNRSVNEIVTSNPFDLLIDSKITFNHIEFFIDLFMICENELNQNDSFDFSELETFLSTFFELSSKELLQMKIRIFSEKYAKKTIQDINTDVLHPENLRKISSLFLLIYTVDGSISEDEKQFFIRLFQYLKLDINLIDKILNQYQIILGRNNTFAIPLNNKFYAINSTLLYNAKNTNSVCKEEIIDVLCAALGIERDGIIEAVVFDER